MERGRTMDAPGATSSSVSLIHTVLLIFILSAGAVPVCAQTSPSDSQVSERATQLFSEQRWQEIVDLGRIAQHPSADFEFYYGTALAQLGRLADAQRAFTAGARMQPRDKRFPLELAGVAFKQKQYPQAVRYLRRALRLDPHDAYGNDFLGTVYFLQGNLEAALKYWNRVDKPQIAQIQSVPVPEVNAALLDRAFAFAPASALRLPDLLTSEVRTGGLGIFPSYQFDLQARDDGKFDVLFRNLERDGWGQTKLEKLFLLFRGLPFLSVRPEFYNLRDQAINFVSMYRWDAQKRRVSAGALWPVQRESKIPLRFEHRLARRKLGYPALVSGSGAAVGQSESAAGSGGRKLCVV